MVAETRSQRLSYTQRPPYPQLPTQSAPASASTSVFQSSSSLASLSSIQQSNAVPQSSPNMLQQQTPWASAPLPSPSTQQPMSYFGSLSQSQHAPTSHPGQQRVPQQYQAAPSGPYFGQRGDGRGVSETAPFLKDFSLVAEAAKRAQMACLTRDLGEVGL